jgi:hypothetical protein
MINCFFVLVTLSLLPPGLPADEGGHLHFSGRGDRVEIEKSKGALDLRKPFTIEMWVRWDNENLDKVMSLATDEAWPGMSDAISAPGPSGWIIRASKLKESGRHAWQFTVGGLNTRKRDWLNATAGDQVIKPDHWQHLAVVRAADVIRVYWNGRGQSRAPLAGIKLEASPTNIFLGVRSHGHKDRDFRGDIRGFHITARAKYSDAFTPEFPFEKDDNTLVLLDFAAAHGKSVPDLSGHGRHGKITGAKIVKSQK